MRKVGFCFLLKTTITNFAVVLCYALDKGKNDFCTLVSSTVLSVVVSAPHRGQKTYCYALFTTQEKQNTFVLALKFKLTFKERLNSFSSCKFCRGRRSLGCFLFALYLFFLLAL